ncbi:hypothetical protein ACVNP1_12375 [Staphylococcus aureus]
MKKTADQVKKDDEHYLITLMKK